MASRRAAIQLPLLHLLLVKVFEMLGRIDAFEAVFIIGTYSLLSSSDLLRL
jgi:hypothetical protein